MGFYRLAAAAAGLSLLCAAPAWAQEREIDGWIFNDDGESCAISAVSEDGHALTMINDGTGGADGLAFISDDLSEVTDKEAETLQYSTNGTDWRDFQGFGIVLSSGGQGYHLSRFPIDMFSAGPLHGTMQFRRRGVLVHSFPLDNVQRAAKEMAACGKKY